MKRVKRFLLITLLLISLAAIAFGVTACGNDESAGKTGGDQTNVDNTGGDQTSKEHTCKWSDWAVVTAPTGDTAGKATRTCSGEGTCEASQTDKEYTLPALTSADYSKGNDSATCTETGSVTYFYNKDGVKVSFDVTTSAKGHGTLASHEAKIKNCLEDGYAAYWACPDCGWLFSDAAGANKIDAPVADAAKGTHGELTAHPTVVGCDEPGTKAYWECPDCHWLFGDAEGTNKIDAPVAVKHPNVTKIPAVAASCTSLGRAEYWTCPDCEKHFSDEALTQEVTDLTELDVDMVAHQLSFEEGVGATCYDEGFDSYWECDECHKFFSDEQAANEISARVTHPKHPNAAQDSNIATSKRALNMTFNAMTRVTCPDCGEYITSATNREVFDSDLIYYKRSGSGYWLFDKDAGETASVNMPQANGGITFVATQTGIYSFTFANDVSISTIEYYQSGTTYTVYDSEWKSVAPAEYFDKTLDTLTNTVTFEAEKNSGVIIKLSSGVFSVSYTYEKSVVAHLNRAYTVEPAFDATIATLTADVPAADEYLVTIVFSSSSYFNDTAKFKITAGTDAKTTGKNIPVYMTLSPNTQFTVECLDTLYETQTYSYTVTITDIKGALTKSDNTVKVTVANSNVDTYTFTAETAEDYTFNVPAGLTVRIPEKNITINAGNSGVVALEANEKVIVVVSGNAGTYTLGISAGASYDPLPNTTTRISFSRQEVKTFSVPSEVSEAGTYKITIVLGNMNYVPVFFALNKADDYATLNGTNATDGSADVVYGGFNSFYKNGEASGFTCTAQMATFYIQLTLKPGDTLTFANGNNATNQMTITIAKV